jgi:DNA-binding IclR family transcriptional regulator
VSLPYLQDLNRQTRETNHLTVRQGLSPVYVEKLESPEPLLSITAPVIRMPAPLFGNSHL